MSLNSTIILFDSQTSRESKLTVKQLMIRKGIKFANQIISNQHPRFYAI